MNEIYDTKIVPYYFVDINNHICVKPKIKKRCKKIFEEKDLLNAKEAKQISIDNQQCLVENEVYSIIDRIKENAYNGLNECIIVRLSDSAREKLTELGYEVEKYEYYFAGTLYTIRW